MITCDDIIKDEHPTLRLIAEKVETPISKQDLQTMKKMLKYLEMSQDLKACDKYNLRPGVGLAAPQINVSKRFFAVLIPKEDGSVYEYGIFNPEIIAESVEMVYLNGGEGCLSIPNKGGNVLRHKKIKIKGIFYSPESKTLEEKTVMFRDYPAIVIQHEYDHLNGVLFTDKITKDTLGIEAI